MGSRGEPAYHGPMDKRRKKALKDKKRQAARQQAAQAQRTPSHYLRESLTLLQNRKEAQAETLLRQGMERFPDSPELYANMVHALYMQGRSADALEMAHACVEKFPDFPDGHNNLGVVYKFEGQMDAARDCYRRALDLAPKSSEFWRNYTALKKFSPEDREEIAQLEALAQQRRHDPKAHPAIFFALGKALEDIGEYEESFRWYRKGNQVMRARSKYLPSAYETLIDATIERYDRAYFERPATTAPCPDPAILVMGTPRSGSTLIEQVLSSHPELEGTGEEADLTHVLSYYADKLPGSWKGGREIPLNGLLRMVRGVAEASDDALRQHAQTYCDRQHRRVPDAPRFVDKCLTNYLNLGFVLRAMPNARVIYSRREPMATCFSNYRILFTSNVQQAYDFEHLAHHYALVERIMDHWKQFAPDRILTVEYEDMVTDLEGQTRRMLEFVGAGWHDDCMRFFENKRRVTSASATQVRRPVYQSSLEQWKRYESQLAPLREALVRHGVLD